MKRFFLLLMAMISFSSLVAYGQDAIAEFVEEELPGGFRYVGYKLNGTYHGKGTAFYEDGSRFEGQWKDGKQSGKGVFWFPDGSRYEGEFVDGLCDGEVVEYYPNGAVKYKGEWKNGRRHGKGIEYAVNGEIIKEGYWEDDYYLFNYEIIQYVSEGYLGTYKGQCVEGLPNGKGTFELKNGTVKYRGEWCNGKFHGEGTLYYANGEENYYGWWVAGVRHGYGILHYSDGSEYKGGFEKGRCSGFGELRYADGRRYEGYFANGLMNGFGIEWDAAGKIIRQGEWHQGEFIQDILIDEIELDDMEEIVEEPAFIKVEVMPSFLGGDLNTFRKWVQGEFKIPAIAAENGIQGRVVVKFVVEKDGSIGGIEFLQSPDKVYEDEVTRVLKKSPKWTPGRQRNQLVRVYYILPIDCRLE